MRYVIFVLSFIAACHAQAAPPSAAAAYSCLSTRSVVPSVKWRKFLTNYINSQDDYKDGFDATFYITVAGRDIGYARKDQQEAIIYDGKLFALGRERLLDGFVLYPAEFNPYMAEWGTVMDDSGKFLCVSFPPNELAMSGSFQKFRSAYLLPIDRGRSKVLYFAGGNIELFKLPSGSLRIGAPFLKARAGIIKSGWRPVRRQAAEEEMGTETLHVRKHFHEVEACSMDLGSLCIFHYSKGAKCLRVHTVGESTGTKRVTSWDNSCPDQSRE